MHVRSQAAAAAAGAADRDAVRMQLQVAPRRGCSLGTQQRRHAPLRRASDGAVPLIADDWRRQVLRAVQPQLVLPT